jgi:hypothetical protein
MSDIVRDQIDERDVRLAAIRLIISAETVESLPDEMRPRVEALLNRTALNDADSAAGTNDGAIAADIPASVSPEAGTDDGIDEDADKLARLRQALEVQYTKWTEGIDDNKLTLEQVQDSFSPGQLEVANTYATPYLLMVPVTDDENPDKITGYEPVIAEGKQEMDPYDGDNLRDDLQDRISHRKEVRREGETGMIKAIYKFLFAAAKKAGKPIDKRFWTMLEDDYSKGDPDVPIAISRYGQPYFYGGHADRPIGITRFRSTVRGNVLNI